MCLTENLNALHRLAWSYLPPAYLLSLLLVSLYLSRFYKLNRVFGRSTCIKMFWQFILLSFSSLSSTSFQLLKCVHLHPTDVFEKANISNWRLADDASFECFAGDHLPWAIIATVVIGVVCVPLPLFLPFLHHYHLLVPFFDVYTSVYKDNRRWWCSVDLLRRLVLAAVFAFVDNTEKQFVAMVTITLGLQFIHAVYWPFKTWKANVLELLLLLSLSIITFLSGLSAGFGYALIIECAFAVSSAIVLVDVLRSFVCHNKEKRLSIQKKPGFGVAPPEGKDDGTMLRERLLADTLEMQ